jgi:hypothetical protein
MYSGYMHCNKMKLIKWLIWSICLLIWSMWAQCGRNVGPMWVHFQAFELGVNSVILPWENEGTHSLLDSLIQ